MDMKTPIKINLALHVVGQRSDGYHLLESLVVFSEDGDRLHIEQNHCDEFIIQGRFAGQFSTLNDNLVVRARDYLRQKTDGNCFPVRIVLEKNLPLSSGIGGGSGDCATTLIALNEIWQAGCTKAKLLALAEALGADIPACLSFLFNKKPLLMAGIGEQLQPLTAFPQLNIVIVNNGTAIATAQVFSALANKFNLALKDPPTSSSLKDVIDYLKTTRNDLDKAAQAIEPNIKQVLTELRRTGALFSRMSGSGGSCFGIYETSEGMARATKTLQTCHPDWFVKNLQTHPA